MICAYLFINVYRGANFTLSKLFDFKISKVLFCMQLAKKKIN